MKINLLEKRYNKLFLNFVLCRLTHSQIHQDMCNKHQIDQKKFNTSLDLFLKIASNSFIYFSFFIIILIFKIELCSISTLFFNYYPEKKLENLI